MKDLLRLALNSRPVPAIGARQAQGEVDGLADRTLAQGKAALNALIEPIVRLLEQAGSVEELERQLPQAYAGMDTADLEDILARAMFVADLFGRWSAGV